MKRIVRRHVTRARFILKDKSENPTLIYLAIQINRKRVKWYTGEKVNPKDWNTAANRAIVRARAIDSQLLNERLDGYAKAALAIFQDWELNTIDGLANYNPNNYKLELDYRTGKQERPETKTEKLDTSDFIRFAESIRDHRKDSTTIVRGTWKVINNHTNLLREFADLKHGGTVAFSEVDEIFIDGLKKFLFRTKGHNRRTVHKIMITLRSIASRAADRGLMTYNKRFRDWAKQEFRKLPQPYLTRSELDKMRALDLSDNQRLEKVRDLFLIGVATAQRWSDFSKLTPKNFIALPAGGYRYRVASQKKTGSDAGGPVMSWVLPILEKYGYIGDGEFTPIKISGQKSNKYLKEVAKLAMPDATYLVYNDGERKDDDGTNVPKWSVLGSHAARRTAVSLLRSMKAPDDQIQKMTGHKTLSELDGYDVRDAEALAMDLGKDLDTAWNRSKLKVI